MGKLLSCDVVFECVGVINRRRGIAEVVEVDETRVSSLGRNAPSQDGKAIILDKDRSVSSRHPQSSDVEAGRHRHQPHDAIPIINLQPLGFSSPTYLLFKGSTRTPIESSRAI